MLKRFNKFNNVMKNITKTIILVVRKKHKKVLFMKLY